MRSDRPRRSWPQRFVIVGGVLAALAAFVSAGAFSYFNTKLADVQRLALSGALTKPDAAPGSPQNFLIVGTDSDLGLDPDDPATHGRGDVSGIRSDTIMILRVDPGAQSAALLSLPRDLWVEIAGTGINQKINAAVGLGGEGVEGPTTLIETIQQNFGIPIHHYVEIDFYGFEQVVDTVGGIPMYFPTGVRDRGDDGVVHTSLDIPAPGCYLLDSTQALAYARTRSIEYQRRPGDDSSWIKDRTQDFGRITRQQDFVRRVLQRAVSKGLTDPLTMNRLIDTGLKAVRVDTDLSAGDLLELGRRFRSFDPAELETVQLPAYATWAGAASIVKLRQPEADAVLARFRSTTSVADGDDPVALTAGIEVQVFNGTGRHDEATKVSQNLAEVGFSLATPSDRLGVTDAASIIRYQAGQEHQAHVLARFLRSEVIFELVDTPTWQQAPPPVQLITGTSYAGVYATPQAATAVTAPTTSSTTTTSTTSTTVASGSTSTSVPTVTTTSLPGFLPGDPPEGVSCH